MKCNKIYGEDKGCHFIAGLVIAIVFALAFNLAIGALVGTLAGVGKELYDKHKYDGFDFFDMFATIAGSVFGVMVLYLIQFYIN